MNHIFTTVGQVLLLVALSPESRIRDIAMQINVTDRTVMIAMSQLIENGLVKVSRKGRRNVYKVSPKGKVILGPHSIELADLVQFVVHSRHKDGRNSRVE